MSLPDCPTDVHCTKLADAYQYRCNNPPPFWQCSPDLNKYRDKRTKTSWQCTTGVFVTCSDYTNVSCCTTYDAGPACNNGSGEILCQSTSDPG